MSTIWMQELSREEISEKAKSGYAIVIPLAAVEQHGPHLPVYTDSLIMEHIIKHSSLKASQHVPLLVAPVMTIGCSDHHLAFGGTLSFSSSTYLHMLREIGESLVTDGFRKIIFLNGHGGNDPMMRQTANDLAVRHPVWTAAASYWQVSRPALEKVIAKEVGMVPGHAGGFETSAVLALRPELVRQDQITTEHPSLEWLHLQPAGVFIGKHKMLTGFNGYTDAPHKATAEKGRAYLDTICHSVSDWLIDTYKMMEKGGAAT